MFGDDFPEFSSGIGQHFVYLLSHMHISDRGNAAKSFASQQKPFRPSLFSPTVGIGGRLREEEFSSVGTGARSNRPGPGGRLKISALCRDR